MTTWWQEHDELVREHGSGHDQTMAPHLVRLLDDVEARFVSAGGDAMRWDDPHAVPGEPYERRDTLDEEYGRVTNPGKYVILDARIDAWVAALAAATVEDDGRSLAEVAVAEGWSEEETPHWPWRTRTLTALTEAPTLLLTTRQTREDVVLYEVGVSAARSPNDGAERDDAGSDVGASPFTVLVTPHCGCDACDSGSDELVEGLDQWILSIVDGSFEIIAKDHRRANRTSFGGDSSLENAHTLRGTRTVTGRSWWPDKRSRPLIPPF